MCMAIYAPASWAIICVTVLVIKRHNFIFMHGYFQVTFVIYIYKNAYRHEHFKYVFTSLFITFYMVSSWFQKHMFSTN